MVLKHGLAATAALAATFFGLGLVSLAHARTSDGRLHANFPPRPSAPKVGAPTVEESGPVTSRNGTTLPPYNTTYYFEQLIDHNNPSKGTFKQRYWHTYEFYERGACYRHPGDECAPDMNALRLVSRRPHRPLHAWRV